MLDKASVGCCQLLGREGEVSLRDEKADFEISHHSVVRSWAYNTSEEK